MTAEEKAALTKELHYQIQISRSVPGKKTIETAMEKLNITGVEWRKVKDFINGRVQHAKKHNL